MIPTQDEYERIERGHQLTDVVRQLVHAMKACSPTVHEMEWLLQEVKRAMTTPAVETIVDQAKSRVSIHHGQGPTDS